MDFFDVVTTQRAIRRLKTDPIPDAAPRPTLTAGASIYPAVQNIMLAARALGMGSCITPFPRFRDARVKELLGTPSDVETAALIPRGSPLGKFGRPPRRPLRGGLR